MGKHEKYPTNDRAEQRMREDAEKGQRPETGQAGRHGASSAPAEPRDDQSK